MSALDPFAKLRLWVTWRAETRQGKATKVPWAPELKWTRASSTDATTWGTRLLAEESARFDGRDGIGIMLAPLGEGRHLGGIDLDSCIGDEGDVASWAREIVELVNSYTEVSPSGHGLKIYLEHDPRETLAEGMRWRKAVRRPSPNGGKEPGIEFYLDRRYFAVTDQLFEGFDTVRHVGLDTLRDVQRRMEASASSTPSGACRTTTCTGRSGTPRAWRSTPRREAAAPAMPPFSVGLGARRNSTSANATTVGSTGTRRRPTN